MELFILLIAMFFGLRWLNQQFCPQAVRLVDAAVYYLLHAGWRWGWSVPRQRFGALMTVWLWFVAATMTVTVVGVVSFLSRGETGFLASVFLAWAIVMAGWYGIRWRSRGR